VDVFLSQILANWKRRTPPIHIFKAASVIKRDDHAYILKQWAEKFTWTRLDCETNFESRALAKEDNDD